MKKRFKSQETRPWSSLVKLLMAAQQKEDVSYYMNVSAVWTGGSHHYTSSHIAPLGSINWESAEQVFQCFSGGDTTTHLGEWEPCNAHTTDVSQSQDDPGLCGHVQQHLVRPGSLDLHPATSDNMINCVIRLKRNQKGSVPGLYTTEQYIDWKYWISWCWSMQTSDPLLPSILVGDLYPADALKKSILIDHDSLSRSWIVSGMTEARLEVTAQRRSTSLIWSFQSH